MKHKHPTHLPPYAPAPVTIVMATDDNPPRAPRLAWLRHLRMPFKTLAGPHPAPQGMDHVARSQLPYNADGVSLSYLSAGNMAMRRVIFIHGSPGQGDEWLPYLADCPPDQYRIAVDRAGYGDSLPAAPLSTITAQARVVSPLLAPDTIIVGYSYGGLVALRLALDHPDLVAGLVLVSCPINAKVEHVHLIQRIAASPLVSWLLPRGLHASNIELLTLQADLTALAPRLDDVTAKVTLLQGLSDALVPASAAAILGDGLRGLSAPRRVLLPDGDHYLPWTHRSTIEQALRYTVQDCDAAESLDDAVRRAGTADAAPG